VEIPSSAKSWEVGWYDVDMDATAAYNPHKKRGDIRKINYKTTKNLNKYG
jgi:hypothetical protein